MFSSEISLVCHVKCPYICVSHKCEYGCIYIYIWMCALWVATRVKGVLIFSIFWISVKSSGRSSLVYFGAKTTLSGGSAWIRETVSKERQGPRVLFNQVKDTKQSSLGCNAGQSSPRRGARQSSPGCRAGLATLRFSAKKGVKQSEDNMKSELSGLAEKTMTRDDPAFLVSV